MLEFFERHEKTKPLIKFANFVSLIFIGIGFAFLIAIFYIIGGNLWSSLLLRFYCKINIDIRRLAIDIFF